MEQVEIKPKSLPSNLLKKDWSKRKLFAQSQAFIDQVHDMPLRPDDVWLVTLPKCGTTWMQELMWLVMNDFDFETAKKVGLEKRSPFLEFNYMINNNLFTALEPVNKLKSPRLIKSHMGLPLLPAQLWNGKYKVVYVYRNPKDSWVSGYYHMRSLGIFMDKTLEEFIQFNLGRMASTEMPFDHVAEFYALRDKPWIYYTSYERMKTNLREVIEDICVFLNKTITEEQMQQMLHHLSFEEMKKNPTTRHEWEFNQLRNKYKMPYDDINFVRKGEVNGYKEELSPELIAKLDEFIEENLTARNLKLDDLLLLSEPE